MKLSTFAGGALLAASSAAWASLYSADVTPDTRPAGAPAGQPVDPDAARALDADDLIRRLTGIDVGSPSDPQTLLAEIQRRMGDSSQRLSSQDPGALTQETQRRIVALLNALIDQDRNRPPQPPPPPGDGPPPPSPIPNPHPAGMTAAPDAVLGPGKPSAARFGGGPVDPNGFNPRLPERMRPIVAQPPKDQFVPTYRAQTEQYYQALADLNKSR